MRQIMEKLLAAQKLQLQPKPLSLESETEILKLRENVPLQILNRFDQFIVRGKKGVAFARNGVCTVCHLRVTSGMLAGLACTTKVHICDNCGRYLFLPESDPLGLSDSPPPIEARAKSHVTQGQRKTDLHVA